MLWEKDNKRNKKHTHTIFCEYLFLVRLIVTLEKDLITRVDNKEMLQSA